jgi:hypothetical protein
VTALQLQNNLPQAPELKNEAKQRLKQLVTVTMLSHRNSTTA